MSEPTGRTLSSYAKHDGDCQKRVEKWLPTIPCTCGLDLLLAGTREGQHDEIPNDETGIGVPASVDVWKDKDQARSDQSGNRESLTNAAATEAVSSMCERWARTRENCAEFNAVVRASAKAQARIDYLEGTALPPAPQSSTRPDRDHARSDHPSQSERLTYATTTEKGSDVPSLGVTRQAIIDILVKHRVIGAREAVDRLIEAARQDALADEDGSYLWERCYACGHRLAFASDGCPQCGIHFVDGEDPPNWPEKCDCTRCEEARNDDHFRQGH